MKFEESDLRYELPSIKEFLANTPHSKLAMSPTLVKAIYGPSSKGFFSVVTERYVVFVHRDSVCGRWISENLTRFIDDEKCLYIKPCNPKGTSFEVVEATSARVTWESLSTGGIKFVQSHPPHKPRKID